MERIDRDRLNLEIATLISTRADCKRLKVGCVITVDNRIVSTGYNGPLKSEVCEGVCDVNVPCTLAVHAEANAIYAAAKNGISLKGGTIYCTHSPCTDCCEAIIQSGIKNLVFSNEFRDTPWERLLNNGITWQQC